MQRDLQEYLDRGRAGNAPWAKARIFGTRVRRNIKLAECPSFGQSIFQYAPGCHGAADYAALAQEVQRDLQEYLDRGRAGNAPWAKARIFGTRVRRNIKLAECPSFGQSIFQYAPTCHGAADYTALAQEVLGEAPAVLAARVELDDRGQARVVSAEAEAAALPEPSQG